MKFFIKPSGIVKFCFESLKSGSGGASKKNKVKEEADSDEEEANGEEMEDEDLGKSKKKKTFSRAPLAKKQTYKLLITLEII